MIIDITRPIHPKMAVYPGNPEVVFERVQKATSHSSALTKITLGSHTGTHVDASSHIDPEGDDTSMYNLEKCVGGAQVVDCTHVEDVVRAEDIPRTSQQRVLIKTRNSSGDPDVFDPDFVALSESAAQEFANRGVNLVGIDAPSIKKQGVKDGVHALLLDSGVVILEGILLADVRDGEYELICLPLRVGLDGAPARAILRSVSSR